MIEAGRPVRWGIMGLGRIAETFASDLARADGCELAAAGSRSLEKSEAFCAKHGGRPCGSYQELVNDPDVDIIYVATPHMVHEENVIMAAEAGKAILCEKPFSINADQTRRMIDAARANGVFLMEGLWSRFFPAWTFTKKLLTEGGLGRIEAILSSTCWGKTALSPSNRLLNPELAGGALLDAGIYSLAAISFATGGLRPDSVASTMRIGSTGVDETTTVTLGYGGKMTATAVSAIFGWSFMTEIICEKATICIPRHRNPDTVIIRRRDQDAPTISGTEEVHSFPFEGEGFQFEAGAVADCLRKGLKECPQAPLSETLMLSEICTKVRSENGMTYPFE